MARATLGRRSLPLVAEPQSRPAHPFALSRTRITLPCCNSPASGPIAFKKARAATLAAAQSAKSCGSACWRRCGVSPRRRRLVSLLACNVADDPADAAAQLLEQAYPAIRASAARFLSLLRQPNEQAQTLLAQARVANEPHYAPCRPVRSGAGCLRPARDSLVLSALRQVQRPDRHRLPPPRQRNSSCERLKATRDTDPAA
jgi:hypothetical protein